MEGQETMERNSRLSSIRSDFPILSQKVNDHPLVYFDSAATSQKPRVVIEAISDYYIHTNSNVHRGVHSLSQRATEQYESSRAAVASFINAAHSEEIIFTSGTTESINLLAYSLSKSLLRPGDEIIVTEMEHHSNFVPWQSLSREHSFALRLAKISDNGELPIDEIKSLTTEKTRILAISHASNTLGSINDIREICRIARARNVLVVVDGAQYIPHFPVNVRELECDFYAFSAHKMFGPTGIGVLYGRKELLKKLPPFQFGGGMISEVRVDKTEFAPIPQVFEAGTPNIAAAIGFRKAIEYINELTYELMEKQEKMLLERATERLMEIPGLHIIGEASKKVSLVSFIVEGLHPFDIGSLLDQMGIAVRTGHHCTQPLMARFGIPGTVRASFAFYNTIEEIEALISGVKRAIKILK